MNQLNNTNVITTFHKKGKLNCIITDKDKIEANNICELNIFFKFDILDSGEVGEIKNMISKKKTKLVEDIYRTAHPRAKEELFYKTSDGRWKSKNPNFSAYSREELVEKLYNYFFSHTFEEVYLEWVDMRIRHGVKSNKTIQEDLSLLRNVFKQEPIFSMQIADIKRRILNICMSVGRGKDL